MNFQFCTRETTFALDLFAFLHTESHLKGTTVKEKNLFPWGASSFFLKSTVFLEGNRTSFTEVPPLKVYQCPIKLDKVPSGGTYTPTSASAPF